MSVISNSPDSIPFECDLTVNPYLEVSKYIGSLIYLGIGLYLHSFILYITMVSQRKTFGESSFFKIFATDSIASICIIICEIFFNRVFLFISPLCPLLGPYFWEPSISMKIAYQITHHSRFAKSVAQIFMVLNRMSCVLMPLKYAHVWKKLTPICVFLVAVLPMGGTWNILISRTFAVTEFGGFATNYIRNVKWASLSLFQSIYVLTAFFFTILCTLITLYKLISFSDRIKSAEKSLCKASFGISITFLFVAVTQLCFAFCSKCGDSDFLYMAQLLAFDAFAVGSAVVMIISNHQLREAMFSKKKAKSVVVVTVPTSS